MEKITVLLSQKEYVQIMRNYLINRSSYRILTTILSTIVLYATISVITNQHSAEPRTLVLWWFLLTAYIGIIPFIITVRAKSIYNNTLFLQEPMNFEFTANHIVWKTSIGEKTLEFKKIFKIENTKHGLILSFSPYQIMIIPYRFISSQSWNKIIEYSKDALGKKSKLINHFYIQKNLQKDS